MTSREHGVLPRGAGRTERRGAGGYRWQSGGDGSSAGSGGLQVAVGRSACGYVERRSVRL